MLVGDFGGTSEVLFFFGQIIMFGYAQHMFIMKALQKLYLARTKH